MLIAKEVRPTNDRLAAARNAKGLSQRALASKLDIAAGHYARLETEDRRPSIGLALRIATLLDRSVEYLFGHIEAEDAAPPASGL